MLNVSGVTRVLVATTPVDLRGSFNRLYGLVVEQLKGEPLSGHLFVFTNGRRPRATFGISSDSRVNALLIAAQYTLNFNIEHNRQILAVHPSPISSRRCLNQFDAFPASNPTSNIVFMVDGWNHDPREVHTIPEVRRFYRQFQRAWPYWFYFCNLDQDGLKPMVFSCLDRLLDVKTDEAPEKLITHYDKREFVGFLAQNLGTMNTICERAKMFETGIYDRSKAVFEYFGLPYKAERPVG